MLSRNLLPVFGAVALLTLAGCTKLGPAVIGDFGSEKDLLVTLRDGETIKGNISEGEMVTFTTIGKVYRARVESFDENGNIVLARPFVQEEYERYALQRDRIEESVLQIRDGTERISIPAYKIVSVQEVSFDRMRSARAAGFWGFTLFVISRVANARF